MRSLRAGEMVAHARLEGNGQLGLGGTARQAPRGRRTANLLLDTQYELCYTSTNMEANR
jgi:hypothetical protein